MKITLNDVNKMMAYLLTMGCKAPTAWAHIDKESIAPLWLDVLGDITAEDLQHATREYLRGPDATWFPSPGGILALIPSEAMASIDTSDETWGETVENVARLGRYQKPEVFHEDPEENYKIAAGISACGGWKALCNMEQSEVMAQRASFRAAYKSAKLKAKLVRQQPSLANSSPLKALVDRAGDSENK